MATEDLHALSPDAADESSLDTPNCPVCLSRMEPDETERGGLHWACTVCGFAAVA